MDILKVQICYNKILNLQRLKSWEVQEQIRKMNEALERSKSKRLSKDETQELKKCYRNIVKELHPDLHPTLTQAQTGLFKNAVEAYKNGDLATIKMDVIKQTFPYTEKETLSSEKKIAQRKKELTSIIADYNGAINILEEKIKKMLVMK